MTYRKDTNSGRDPKLDTSCPAPDDNRLADGQYKDHWVLPEEERRKGFVRPLRHSYRHVGIPGPLYPLRDLTPEEAERFHGSGYVKFESYPEEMKPRTGRFWTKKDLDRANGGCGAVTTMSTKIAETYAREPGYYGSTFCSGCGTYFPVGDDGEFVWDDGSEERVGD